MAHLGVALLELQGWVAYVILGQDKDTGEEDPREKQISSSCVLAVEGKSTRLPRPREGKRWLSSPITHRLRDRGRQDLCHLWVPGTYYR